MPLFLQHMTEIAKGTNYFDTASIALKVNRINRSLDISHKFDLTEIEHQHDFVEIVCIINGNGIQVVEEQEYKVTAGDVFVLQGQQKHYFKDAQNIEIVNIIYDENQISNLVNEEIKSLDAYRALFLLEPQYRAAQFFQNKLHLNRKELAKIELLLNAMIYEQKNKFEGYQLILKNRLQELMIILSRHYSEIDGSKAQSLVQISKVINYLDHHSAEKLYLDDLALMANMSKRNFQRVFKKSVGMTPNDYLLNVRLQKARMYLRESQLSMAQIAYDTGFSDRNYFIKCFKKANGVSPMKFRNRFDSNTFS